MADAPLYGSGTLDSHLTVNVSNLQPKDATLTSLSLLDSAPGVMYQTGADTFTKILGGITGTFNIGGGTAGQLSSLTFASGVCVGYTLVS